MPRTFTEAEAQKVFAHVAERQRAAGPAAGGLTLGDLEEAARAAGLDPALVASAVADLDAPAPTRTLLGAPTEVAAQRTVAGAVSDDAWEAMVAAARAEFGRAGIAGQIGRTREWTASTGTGNTQATTRLALEPAGDDTRIVVTRSARDVVLGFTIGGTIMAVMSVVFGSLFAAGVDPELWIPALILAFISAVFLGGTRVGLRAWNRVQGRRTEALLDRLELAAQSARPVSAPSAGHERSAGRVDPALFDADAPDGDAPDGGAGADRVRSRT